MIVRTLFSILTGLLLTTSCLTCSAAPAKLRVLLVTGGHDFDHKAFAEMLDSFTAVTWREVTHPDSDAWFTPEKRGQYDIVALYDMPQQATEAHKKLFSETIRQGKGLLVLHHALGAYNSWPEYTKIIGGKYLLAPETIDGKQWPGSTYHEGVSFRVHVADPKHPITKGLKDYDIDDEVYGGFLVEPMVHALLQTDFAESGPIIGWTHQYGKARVVYLAGGHGPSAYINANYRLLVQRSILWVAGKLK